MKGKKSEQKNYLKIRDVSLKKGLTFLKFRDAS